MHCHVKYTRGQTDVPKTQWWHRFVHVVWLMLTTKGETAFHVAHIHRNHTNTRYFTSNKKKNYQSNIESIIRIFSFETKGLQASAISTGGSLPTWLILLSSREEISRLGMKPLTTPSDLGTSPPSSGSLGSLWIRMLLILSVRIQITIF